MTCDEFVNIYWKNYILIEKEFSKSLEYVDFSVDNYEVYSKAYVKLLLKLGSEIDVVFKGFCEFHNPNKKFEKMPDYKSHLNSNMPNIMNQDIIVISNNSVITPWKYTYNNGKLIVWWRAYNEVKHNRHKEVTIKSIKKHSYKFANLENCLNALGFLYQLLLNWYRELAILNNERIVFPLPGSRLFKITGDGWEKVKFVFDDYFYVENGDLYDATSSFPY